MERIFSFSLIGRTGETKPATSISKGIWGTNKFTKLETSVFESKCCFLSVLLHEGNYVKLSLQFTHSHLCFFADWEAEVLQNFHHGQFNHHQSKSRPHAAPWPSPKWKVSIWVDVLLVFLTKSVKQIEKICQIPTIYKIFFCLLWLLLIN